MTVAAPTVVLDDPHGRAVITVSLPDFATITTFTVKRIETLSGLTSNVRTLIDVHPLGTLTQGFDYELPMGLEVRYMVTVVRGTTPESSPLSTAVTWVTEDVWLKDVGFPERSQRLGVVSLPDVTYGARQGRYNVLNSRNPVVVSDVRSGATGTITCYTLTLEDRQALLDLLAPADVLLFQAPPEYGVPNLYVAIGDAVESRVSPLGYRAPRTYALPFVEVDAPTLAVSISDFTYQDVLDAYATYRLVLDGESSYYDLLTSPGTATGVATAARAPRQREPLFEWSPLPRSLQALAVT